MQIDYQIAVQHVSTTHCAEWAVLSVSCACAELQQAVIRHLGAHMLWATASPL